MPTPVRVLVVDDDQFVRNAIRWLLAPATDLQLVGEITNLAELPALCSQTTPQLLLIGGG